MKKICLGIVFSCTAFAAKADTHPCFEINPTEQPEAAVVACTDLLETQGILDETRTRALVERGVANRTLGNFDTSIADLEQALEVSPQDTSAQRMLAWTYREMSQYEKAEALYTKVLETDQHWQGWLSRCAVRTGMGKYKEALSDCAEAEEQFNSPDVMYFKGLSYLNLNQPHDALQTVKPGLSAKDINGRLYQIAAVAYWNSGQHHIAITTANDGLDKYPNDPDLLWFLSEAGVQ